MKLIVLAAFDDVDGELVPAFEARERPTAERAIREAREMATLRAGVIAWQREANPDVGEYGEPEVLFQHGRVPDME